MEKLKNFRARISKHFQLLLILFFILLYFRWLYVTPLEFKYYNDPNESIIFGGGLLVFYIFTSLWLYKINNLRLRFAVGVLTVTLFFLNLMFFLYFFPRTVTKTRCNNTNYIISTSSTLSDPQWTYYQFTKWKGIKYETFFFGYPGYDYKIICDEKQNEANVVIPSLEAIDYTDGASPHSYIHSSARLNDALFIVSNEWHIPDGCNPNSPWDCDSFIYTLYECKSNYTECHPLPIRYINGDEKYSYLEIDLIENEINLFSTEDDTLIFTYGKNPRCYVEGCEIFKP